MSIDVLRVPAATRARGSLALSRAHLARVALVGGATAVAAVLRLHALGAQSLWQDEALSVWTAHKSVPQILAWLRHHSVHPPLYFLLLHVWLRHSTSVAWIRLLSAIPSVLVVPFVYGLARRLFRSNAIGVVAALLVAVSPFNVYYGQEARMYSLLSLAAVAASYFLVLGLQTNRRSAWVGYGIAGVVVVYTQNVGVFVLAAHALILLTLALWRRREAVRGLIALAAVMAAWTPWLPVVGGQTGKGGATWVPNPTPVDLRDLAGSFTSYALPLHVHAPLVGTTDLGWRPHGGVPPVAAAAIAGYLVVALLGLASLRRNHRALFVAALLLLGPVTFEIDQGLVAPVFVDRTLIFVSVAYLAAVAAGVVLLLRMPRTRPLGVAGLAALLLLNALSLRQYYDVGDGQTVKEQWNAAAATIARDGRRGDVLLFQANTAEIPFDYYYARETPRARLPELGVPCPIDSCSRFEADATPRDASALAAEVGRARRLWLVKRWYGNWSFDIVAALGHPTAFRLHPLDGRTVASGVVVNLYEIVRTPRLSRPR